MSRSSLLVPFFVSLIFAVGCTKEEKASPVDHGDPRAVVEAVFEAARIAEPSQLSGLCDPKGENDGDTKKICELKKGSKMFGEFIKVFQLGKTVADAKIDGDQAEVSVKFGPDGTSDETMRLVNRDGKWYLSGF